MCCYTRTLKTLHRLCPSAPKQGWVFCAEAHLKVLPWVGPLSLSLLLPLPKPTVPPSAHQQCGHCLRLCHLPQLRSWRAGLPRQGGTSVSSPCTSCCAFPHLCIAKGTTALWDLAKTRRVFIRKVDYRRMPTARRMGPNRPSAVWRRGEDTWNTFL